jgi:hypothetical protein
MDPLLKAIQQAVGSTTADGDLGNAPLQQADLEKIYIAVTGRKWMGAAHPQEVHQVFSPPAPIHPPSTDGQVAPAVAARVPLNDPAR